MPHRHIVPVDLVPITRITSILFWSINFIFKTMVKLDWENQIVLITGGGSGIGALLAETLAMRNITTVVLSQDPVVIDTNNG
jgi:FlaA1/EpsC-like NDP-sugar epimerase